MSFIERRSRCAAAGLTVSLLLLALVAIGSRKAVAAESSADIEPLFQADDFWSRTGARLIHPDIPAQAAASVQDLAEHSPKNIVRVRARKVLADQNGRTRYPDKLPKAQAWYAVEATFRYLETHLDDKTVAKFHPELGFTHVTLSNKSNDNEGLWLLIETADGPLPHGGLNVRWNTSSKEVDKVEHWGATRDLPVPPQPNPDKK